MLSQQNQKLSSDRPARSVGKVFSKMLSQQKSKLFKTTSHGGRSLTLPLLCRDAKDNESSNNLLARLRPKRNWTTANEEILRQSKELPACGADENE